MFQVYISKMPKNDRLFYLVKQLEKPDLILLLKNGLRSDFKLMERYSCEYLIGLISKELRSAAGHSVVNLFRDRHDFPYKQILVDVANKLTEGYFSRSGFRTHDNHSEEEIEKEIIRLFELRTKKWWKGLEGSEKGKIVHQINQAIDANIICSVSNGTLTNRITEKMLDGLIRRGLVGFFGGALLASVQWTVIINTIASMVGMQMLVGAGGATLGMLGLSGAGVAAIVPGVVLSLTNTNYKKTIPAVIMLLSKIYMKNSDEGVLTSNLLL